MIIGDTGSEYFSAGFNSFIPSIPSKGQANSVNPDQTLQNVASDQGLPRLH